MQNNTFSRIYLGQSLIVLDQVPSTNDYLKNLLSNITPSPEGTAIMALEQTAGKGQRGSVWLSEARKNLTFSFLLYPTQLSPMQSFELNMLISIGIFNWVSKHSQQVKIKWPNDIYINNKKIGGVLIENQLSHKAIKSSVVGIGINLNQASFPAEIQERASSLLLACGQSFDIKQTCLDLLHSIMETYSSLNALPTAILLEKYNDLLYQKDIAAPYEIHGQLQECTLRGVDAHGHLLLETNSGLQSFDLKEVRFK